MKDQKVRLQDNSPNFFVLHLDSGLGDWTVEVARGVSYKGARPTAWKRFWCFVFFGWRWTKPVKIGEPTRRYFGI